MIEHGFTETPVESAGCGTNCCDMHNKQFLAEEYWARYC